jgi:hypothetical protein
LQAIFALAKGYKHTQQHKISPALNTIINHLESVIPRRRTIKLDTRHILQQMRLELLCVFCFYGRFTLTEDLIRFPVAALTCNLNTFFNTSILHATNVLTLAGLASHHDGES